MRMNVYSYMRIQTTITCTNSGLEAGGIKLFNKVLK
jgi:hypothetical protein